MNDDIERMKLGKDPGTDMVCWETFVSATNMLALVDWSSAQALKDRADSIGHILDPTGYKAMLGNPNVEDNVKLANAAHLFLMTCKAVKEAAQARAAKAGHATVTQLPGRGVNPGTTEEEPSNGET